MVSISWEVIALRWCFFFATGSAISVREYSPLYFKHLGFSAFHIGVIYFIAVTATFLLPLTGFVGDTFRARKLVLILVIFSYILTALAPLLPLVVPRVVKCILTSNSSAINHVNEFPQNEGFHFENEFSNDNSYQETFPYGINKSSIPTHVMFYFSSLSAVDSHKTLNTSKQNTYHSSLSTSLFAYIAVIGGLYITLGRMTISLLNVSVLTTVIKDDRSSYGSYYCFAQIGGSLSLFVVGMLASQIDEKICGNIGHGYFVTFPFAAIATSLSLVALPWINYVYLQQRVINWPELRSFFFNSHYVLMLLLTFYLGCCFAFQQNWEYWYMDELNGSPALMGIGGLVRRPFVAIWFLLSTNVIKRLGELNTIIVGLSLYAISTLSLSLIETAWLVLVTDVFQSAAFAFSYSSLTIHFSKAASKASSGVIQGILEMLFALGVELGSACLGQVFHSIGTRATLRYLSITTAIIFVLYIVYVYSRKNLDEYERAPSSDSEDDE